MPVTVGNVRAVVPNRMALANRVREIMTRRGGPAGVRCPDDARRMSEVTEVLGNALIARMLGVLEDVTRVARHRYDTQIEHIARSEDADLFETSGADVRAIIADTRRREAEERKALEQNAEAQAAAAAAAAQKAAAELDPAIAALRKEEAARRRAEGEKQQQINRANMAALAAIGRRPPPQVPMMGQPQPPMMAMMPGSTASTPAAAPGSGVRLVTIRDLQACHRRVGYHVLQKFLIKKNRQRPRFQPAVQS
jgi:hypothetical protein